MKYKNIAISTTITFIFLAAIFFAITTSPNWYLKVNAAQNQDHMIFIPLALDHYPINSLFGVQISYLNKGFDEAMDLNVDWLRYNGVIWSRIEPDKGVRDWDTMGAMESELIEAAQNYQNIVMIVRSTPDWAQQIPGAYCGPIKPQELQAFGSFMYDVIDRYSGEPFNIKYWEIWNEPDVPSVDGFQNAPFGCWGDLNDDYYGGGYFAEMLKVVYPQIKSADPTAQVVIGGLLLDCDPRTGSDWCGYWKHDDRPPKFLEGILRNNGGNYFDGVAFHGYDYFDFTDPELGEYLNPVWGNSWNGILWDGSSTSRIGPVSIYKAEYITGILNNYGISNKFLMNTEAALICGLSDDPPGGVGCESEDNSLFEQTKARYVPESYAASIKLNLKANTWYSLFGWRNSGLVNEDLSTRPAYQSYKVARRELGGAKYIRMIDTYPGVLIYEFQRSDDILWFIRSLDGSPHTITFSSTPNHVKDFMGIAKTPSSTFTATIDPHYLIWYP